MDMGKAVVSIHVCIFFFCKPGQHIFCNVCTSQYIIIYQSRVFQFYDFANKEVFKAVQGNITPSIRFFRTELFKAVKVTILRHFFFFTKRAIKAVCWNVTPLLSFVPREHNIAVTMSLSFGPAEL